MAEASTMFLTMKRLMALSLGTSTPEDSQRTRLTCNQEDGAVSYRPTFARQRLDARRRGTPRNQNGRFQRAHARLRACSPPSFQHLLTWPRPCLLRPPFLRFLVMLAVCKAKFEVRWGYSQGFLPRMAVWFNEDQHQPSRRGDRPSAAPLAAGCLRAASRVPAARRCHVRCVPDDSR
jgi:hypothetical protein